VITSDLGMVYVIASGVRHSKSKLKYFAQKYCIAEYSLVRGKDYWRLTGAREIIDNSKLKIAHISFFAKISLVLKRLIQGEIPHNKIFYDIYRCAQLFVQDENIDTVGLESLMVYRIVHELGYINHDSKYGDLIASEINNQLILEAHSKRTEINKVINKALKESHL
jgi:recombinational DNA repair protein (RecF pathway)